MFTPNLVCQKPKSCMKCAASSYCVLCNDCMTEHFVTCLNCLYNPNILDCESYITPECLKKYAKWDSLLAVVNNKIRISELINSENNPNVPKKRKICCLCEEHYESKNGACDSCNSIVHVELLV